MIQRRGQSCIVPDVSEVHDVEGYVLCGTGEHTWVLAEVARRTGGLCSDCFIAQGSKRRDRIELVGGGARLEIPARPRRKRDRHRDREHDKLVEKCRERAKGRLASIFPDLYDILLAEERAAAGLEPWPVDMAVRAQDDPDGEVATQFAELALELDKIGAHVP